eukprot:gene4104-5854_t
MSEVCNFFIRFLLLLCCVLAYNNKPSRIGTNVGHGTKNSFYDAWRHSVKIHSNKNELHTLSRCDLYAEKVLRPRWGGFVGPVVRYINSCLVGLIGVILLRMYNKFSSFRSNILFNQIFNRPKSLGLLSVSNHQSMLDDPMLWAAFLPWWKIGPETLRWQLCTEDFFFNNPILQSVLGAGNVLPLDRSGSLEQPMFLRFFEKLNAGKWCHIFCEGKIIQNWRFEENERKLGPFKAGVGKLIAHCKQSPIIVPMYHKNMDTVFPEKVLSTKKKNRPSTPISPIPRGGNHVQVFVGEPFSVAEIVERFKLQHPEALNSWRSTSESLSLYAEITEVIRQKILLLEEEAWGKENKERSQASTSDKS